MWHMAHGAAKAKQIFCTSFLLVKLKQNVCRPLTLWVKHGNIIVLNLISWKEWKWNIFPTNYCKQRRCKILHDWIPWKRNLYPKRQPHRDIKKIKISWFLPWFGWNKDHYWNLSRKYFHKNRVSQLFFINFIVSLHWIFEHKRQHLGGRKWYELY